MVYNRFGCNGLSHALFSVRKIDRATGNGLAGAVFELTACNGLLCSGVTNEFGLVSFCVLPCNAYALKEISPPVGYMPVGGSYNICVDACGCIYVNGCRTSEIVIGNTAILASFSAIKINIENGMPLAGAEYALFQASVLVASAVSTDTGAVTFKNLSPGIYELAETIPPPGFQINTEKLPVAVNQDGSVTILGNVADGFVLGNVPLSSFIFIKLDASTELPLAGAVFRLIQNGTVIAAATSSVNGAVDFGILSPGVYELSEIASPPGYLPNDTIYRVVVDADGFITVDGLALDDFRVRDLIFPGFSFTTSSNTTGLPLAGAVFQLRQNGTLIGTSISDLSGIISFSGLAPGSYQMEETQAPAGYVSPPVIYEVVVSSNGAITIDGLSYEEFSVENLAVQNSDSYSLSTDVIRIPLASRLNMQGFSLEEGVNGNTNMPSGVGVPATQPSFFSNVFDGSHIWLNPALSDKMVRVSAMTGTMLGFSFAEGVNGNENMGNAPTASGKFTGGALVGSHIWLTPYNVNRLVKLDISTGSMLGFSLAEGVNGNVNMGTLETTNSKFQGSVYDGTFIWLIPATTSKVVRVDPANGSMRGFDLTEGTNGNINMPTGGNYFNGGIFDGRYVWMIPFSSSKVVRLDPVTGSMKGYDMTEGVNGNINMGNVGNTPLITAGKFYGGAFDGIHIWMIPGNANRIIRLNPVTGSMIGFELAEGINGNTNMGNADTVNFKFVLGNCDGRNIWMFPFSATRLVKLNPQTGSMTGYELGEGSFTDTTNTNMGDIPTAASGKFYGGCYDGQNLWASPYRTNRLVKISSAE